MIKKLKKVLHKEKVASEEKEGTCSCECGCNCNKKAVGALVAALVIAGIVGFIGGRMGCSCSKEKWMQNCKPILMITPKLLLILLNAITKI